MIILMNHPIYKFPYATKIADKHENWGFPKDITFTAIN